MDRKIFAILNCLCAGSYVRGAGSTCVRILAHWYRSTNSLPTTGSLQGITVKKCGTSIVPPTSPDRIVGGGTTVAGEYPWVVSFQKNLGSGIKHNCGGSILNENWIITAAHCISFNDTSQYRILAGLHKLSEDNAPTVQHIKISKLIVHENYSGSTNENDIALLKTATPIDIAGSKGYVNGICLPKTVKDPKGYAKVIGWGDTKYRGENSDTLKEVIVPIIPRDICNKAYESYADDKPNGKVVQDTMICAGMEGKSVCQGDSGGPLFQTNSKGVSTLIGLASFLRDCGEKYYPGVFTKVSPYVSWIENIMATY